MAARKRRKSFIIARVRAFYHLSTNQLSYDGFFRRRRSLLEGILLHSFIAPAENPHQY
jgi:hypothetical protein